MVVVVMMIALMEMVTGLKARVFFSALYLDLIEVLLLVDS